MDGELLTESRLLTAYQVLFAASGQVNSSLLQSVQLPEIKQAYRRRALDTHPDRFVWGDENCRKQCTERFIEVTDAYETLNHYLVLRDKGLVGEGKQSRESEPVRKAYSSPASKAKPASRFGTPGETAASFAYWEKGVPGRRLRFGEFLYYSGAIPWKALIGALVWQRRQRPKIGEIAQRWRWLTESQIFGLLQKRHPGERLGEVLVRRRIISPFQLEVLLWQQQKIQKRIGEYFLCERFLTQAQIRRHLHQQHQHNLRFCSDLPRNVSAWFSQVRS